MDDLRALKSISGEATDVQKLGILRHEFLVPLSIIKGYATLLEQRVAESDEIPHEFKIWINIIKEKSAWLSEALDILTKSDIQDSK